MNSLHRSFRAPALLGLVFILAACSPTKVTLKAVGGAWSVIEPRYREYVLQDQNLSGDSKTLRLETADLMTKALKEASR